jgi:hypothetical protein
MTRDVLAQWKSIEEFGFTGGDPTYWDLFHRALMSFDIELDDIPDTIILTGGDHSGVITTKNAYETIVGKYWLYNR